MSDSSSKNSKNNNRSEQSEQNPIPINVPPSRFSSRHLNRTVSFPDSTYDPPVTTESQQLHGHDEESIDPSLQPIEEENNNRRASNDFSTFPRRLKKELSPTITRRFSKFRPQSPHSLAWSALRHFNGGSMETPSPFLPSEDVYQRDFIYSEPPLVMSPGEESIYSVIMDDGTLQRRRISLTSIYSRQNAATEQTPLLHGYDNSDSDTEDANKTSDHRHHHHKSGFKKIKAWFSLTRSQKNILKCALAYFLASLFTFVPILNSITGLKDSKNSHLVATVAVFFNPAKTVGGMYEAVVYSIVGGLFGSLIAISSMASAVWLNNNDQIILSRIITVVIWCGGSMFIVAFLKAKLNKPTFNSACSLANIIIFVILVKEVKSSSSYIMMDKVIQVTKIIFFGVCISFLVSICVWPVSASKKLKTEIGETLRSFRLLLKLLTKTFLIDDINYTDESVQTAIKSHQATFTSLKNSLNQASLEIHNLTMRRQLGLYKETINSLQRLAQYLGGLRSCCGLQWEIIDKNKKFETSISHEDLGEEREKDDDDEEEFLDLRNLREIIHYVGPSMKSLAFTCKQTISHLQSQFDDSTTFLRTSSFTLLHQNLSSALDLFEKSQTRSITKLYRKKTDHDSRPNEEIFLTYFFVFNLQEFARELIDLVDLVDNIDKLDAAEQRRRERRRWWQFWLYFGWFSRTPSDFKIDKNFFERIKRKFPENTSNVFDTIQTPIPKTFMQKIAIKTWKSLTWFRQFEVKYAFKAAVSAAILASPAFIDKTSQTYLEYRGEWACISMMVVMVPTVGGANLIGIYRACGTLFGSFIAWFIYTLFPDNGFVVAIFGFLIALGSYYFILYTKYNRIGQFVLLTYNLVALYKFNLRDSEDDYLDIIDIARYRAIAVGTGIIWGVYVTNYWWPYEARVELRKGLSQFFINTSWLYNKLVAVYSAKSELDETINSSHTVVVPLAQHESSREFVEMELYLQLSVLKLKDLLLQTPNEPRMKGPFPVETYNEILIGCQNILDKLLSMRVAVTKEEWYTSIRRDFIVPVSKERKELVGNVILYFYIIAAALKLKTPLPPYLPPAEKARKRLVKKIRDLPVVKQRIIEGNDERYIVYYAYVLVMEDIIRELERLGSIMQELFGCIGGHEFDYFFRTENNALDGENDVSGVISHPVNTASVQQGVVDNVNNADDYFGIIRDSSSQTDTNRPTGS